MLAFLGERIASLFGGGEELRTSTGGPSFEAMSQFNMATDLLPYVNFDPPTRLFGNGDSRGFVLETVPLVGSSEEMQKEITALFTMLMPVGSSLQIMLWADPHIESQLGPYVSAREGAPPTLQKLAQQRAAHLRRFAFHSPVKPYTLRTFRVLVSFTLDKSVRSGWDDSALVRLRQQMVTMLGLLGLPVTVWEAEDLLNTVPGILFMKADGSHTLPRRWNPLMTLADQLGDGEQDIGVHAHELTLGTDVAVRTLSVRQYPQAWSLHAMGSLIGDMERDQAQIPCPFILHYGVHIPAQEQPKTQILAKASYVEKQAYSPMGKYLPDITREAEELAFVREHMNKGERIVHTHFAVTLLGPQSTMDEAEQTVRSLFTAKEWTLEANRYVHLPIFLSCLPMMWGEEKVRALLHLKKLKTTLSTEAANLLPLQGEWTGTSTPGMILGGRRGQVMTWYPFDNNAGNYNACVVGRSGSGKSVFMQELMTTTLGLGGRVFVMDVGRSFEKTCFMLEGQFIEFTPKTNLCLNPFTSIPAHDPDVAADALAMLKSILILMAAPSQGVDDKGAALLEQAMLETWQAYGNEANLTQVAHWLTAHKDAKARDLGQMLFPYTDKGTYGRFFNGPSTVNFQSNLVVVELEELKERKDLQAVIVQMVVVTIASQMFLGDRQTPFHIVFDEAWDMLRGKQSGVFIETLARRLRKYRGSLIVGTQSINDFFVNPGAQAAFDNSDWMCLLSQKPESIEQLKKTDRLSLSPQKESLLKSVKTKQGAYAEVMISGSSGYAVGRLLLDPFASLLYSTKAEDYAAIKALMAQGTSLEEAIHQLMDTPGRAA